MILCGGQGTRLRDVTELLPKPMVSIGPHPIVWHIMKCFSAYGIRRFILCLGYKREKFIDYFLNYHAHATDMTVHLGNPPVLTYHGVVGEEDWEVTLADTGDRTMTGARIARAARYLHSDDHDILVTYGDGLANVNVHDLLRFHSLNKNCITVTAVHPSGRFGEMKLDGQLVCGFQEKPQTEDGLINGGYMVIRRSFIEQYLTTDPNLSLEHEPMRRAVADRQMSAYIHDGFWQCMDTPREYQLLNQMWESGDAPWKVGW